MPRVVVTVGGNGGHPVVERILKERKALEHRTDLILVPLAQAGERICNPEDGPPARLVNI